MTECLLTGWESNVAREAAQARAALIYQCCAILLLLLWLALPPVDPPPAKRHVCILDQLLVCCHTATAPAQASVLPISSHGSLLGPLFTAASNGNNKRRPSICYAGRHPPAPCKPALKADGPVAKLLLLLCCWGRGHGAAGVLHGAARI